MEKNPNNYNQTGLITQEPFTGKVEISKNLLTPERVNDLYSQATLNANLDPDKISKRNPLTGDFEFFKPSVLKSIKNDIATLKIQLPEPLFNGNLGASVDYAYFNRYTKLSDIKEAFKNNKIPNFAWTDDETVRNRLLSLIVATDSGRFTTPPGKAGSKYHPNISTLFWIF